LRVVSSRRVQQAFGFSRQGRISRHVVILLAIGLAVIPALALAPTTSARRSRLGAGQSANARAADAENIKDEGRLRLVKSSGSQLIDEGPASGTIPGKVRIVFAYNGDPTVSAQITIYGHGGTLQAHATGHLSSPTSASPSFKGTLTITGGDGRYAHAHGAGQLYGVFYRRSYAITVQTEGTLHY
jgi:hypothetical protein